MHRLMLTLAVLCVPVVLTAQPLDAPQLVVYRLGTRDSVKLTWNAVPEATGYDLFTCDAVGGDTLRLGTTTEITYRDGPLASRRFYRVRARNADTVSTLSNTAGYVAIPVIVGSTPFGLPLRFWQLSASKIPQYGIESYKPSDIIGSQARCGTIATAERISQMSGNFAYRSLSNFCHWTGRLETDAVKMIPGKSYYFRASPIVTRQRCLVLTGEADTTAGGIPTVYIPVPSTPAGFSVPYSWRDPRDLPISRLNLLASGFTGGTRATSDRISMAGGDYAWYQISDHTWGGFTTVIPGKAYFIVNKHPGHPWAYTYDASGRP